MYDLNILEKQEIIYFGYQIGVFSCFNKVGGCDNMFCCIVQMGEIFVKCDLVLWQGDDGLQVEINMIVFECIMDGFDIDGCFGGGQVFVDFFWFFIYVVDQIFKYVDFVYQGIVVFD